MMEKEAARREFERLRELYINQLEERNDREAEKQLGGEAEAQRLEGGEAPRPQEAGQADTESTAPGGVTDRKGGANMKLKELLEIIPMGEEVTVLFPVTTTVTAKATFCTGDVKETEEILDYFGEVDATEIRSEGTGKMAVVVLK